MENSNLEMTKAGDELVAVSYNRFDGIRTYCFRKVIRTTKTLINYGDGSVESLVSHGCSRPFNCLCEVIRR